MKPPGTKRLRVRRITIDERLDGDLIKIGIAELLPGHVDISDDVLDGWSDEVVRLIRPRTMLTTFGLRAKDPLLATLAGELAPKADASDLRASLWRSLEEGQVFFVGEIEIAGDDRSQPDSIVACAGASSVIRVDRIPGIKTRHKKLYSEALKEGS
jgi:hypothetical protein